MKVTNLVAVVTGGSSGIGLGIGKALAEKGCHVVVADVDGVGAEAAAAELRQQGVKSIAVKVDVSDRESVEHLANSAWEEFGQVDLLFNNAGVAIVEKMFETPEQDLQWLYGVNVFGVWNGCSVFGRRFFEQGTPAWICNTGSEHSLGVANPGTPIYTAGKHAVLGMTDSMRNTLGDSNIGFSVLCPGIVNTTIWNSQSHRGSRYGEVAKDDVEQAIAKEVLSHGMDPLDVGRRVIAGIDNEEFYILTHPDIRLLSDERAKTVAEASRRQVPADGELVLKTPQVLAKAIKKVLGNRATL